MDLDIGSRARCQYAIRICATTGSTVGEGACSLSEGETIGKNGADELNWGVNGRGAGEGSKGDGGRA